MLAPRIVMNLVYAHCVREMDAGQRREFDNELYGFTALNQHANKALHSGGEG